MIATHIYIYIYI